MKVTYQTCCGVDVHKSFLVATIVKTTGGIEPSYQKKRFSTFNNFILEFKHRLTRAHREKQLKMSCQALHNAPPNRT